MSSDVESYSLYVGYNDSGTIDHASGINTIDHILSVGKYDTGAYTQTGGSVIVSTCLQVGVEFGSNGAYNLVGGDVVTNSLQSMAVNIGHAGVGVFNQSGGTLTTYGMTLGYSASGHGTYNLSAGSLVVANKEYIGEDGTGIFYQTGGANSTKVLTIGENGTYTMSAGSLSISDYVEINGTMHFTDSDWFLSVTGGVANFSDAVIDGAGSASFYSAANSLTIFAAGFDFANEFGSYNTDGLVCNADNIVISTGHTITSSTYHSRIDDFVNVQGGYLDMTYVNGGLALSDGGEIQAQDIEIDNGTTGSIDSSGGTLYASGDIHIGRSGQATFTQTGGTTTAYHDLYLGEESAGNGTYNLSGGSLTVSGYEYIGDEGTAAFNQTGGDHSAAALIVGENGSYTVSGGSLSIAWRTQIDGAMHFTDSDWSLNITGYVIDLSKAVIDGAGSASFYSAAGTLTIFATGFDFANEFGSYNAEGLVCNADNVLIPVGYDIEGYGTYSLDDAFVHVQGSLTIHALSSDIAISEGGMIETDDFELDDGKTGSIAASGGTLNVVNNAYIGRVGTGTFTQNGGTFIVEDSVNWWRTQNIYIGYEAGSIGGYTLTGGEIQTDVVAVGYYGDGEFNQTGGIVDVEGVAIGRFGTSLGAYNMSGGTITAADFFYLGNLIADDENSGRLFFTGGEIAVDGIFIIGYSSYIDDEGNVDGTITIGEELTNYSYAYSMFDLRHTTVIMDSQIYGDPALIDMHSQDYGATIAGLDDNFALGHLVFSGTANDSMWYKLESDIYCYGLTIEEGAKVDLNGYNIYYMPGGAAPYSGIAAGSYFCNGEVVDNGGAIIAIADAPPVPEPCTIALLTAGALGLAGVIRRHK